MIQVLLPLLLAVAAHATEIKVTADQPLNASHPLRGATSFELGNSIGTLSVEPIDGGEIKLAGTTDSKEEITVTFAEIQPGQFKLDVVYPPGLTTTSFGSGDVIIGRGRVMGDIIMPGPQPLHLRIGIPRDLLADLKMNTDSGRLESRGAFPGPLERQRSVSLTAGSGKITCDQLCAFGNFEIRSNSGDVELRRAKAARASVNTGSGEVYLNTVDADLTVETNSGNISSQNGVGPLVVKTGSGGVELEDPSRGMLRVRTNNGNVTARGGVGATILITGSGRLDIANRGDGPVNIESNSADVKLKNVCGSFSLTTGSGRIKIQDCPGAPMELETNSGDVTIAGSAGDLKIKSGSGRIQVEDHSDGQVRVKTNSGDITFANSNASVVESADSRSGRVRFSPRSGDCDGTLNEKKKSRGIFDF